MQEQPYDSNPSGNVALPEKTGRVSRTMQLFLVLTVGFLSPVVGSIYLLLGRHRAHPATHRGFTSAIVLQLISLLVLYLVLKHQKRRFLDIGLTFEIRLVEIGHAFALFFGGLFSGVLAHSLIKFIWILSGFKLQTTYSSATVFGVSRSILPVLFICINGFHEELLVRAFLITETEAISKSTALAIVASVTLQTSYHLYQGWPAALSHVPAFLLFSLYFARTRRILPVVLAHIMIDLLAISVYFSHIH